VTSDKQAIFAAAFYLVTRHLSLSLRTIFPPLREVHARCVKFSRIWPRRGKSFCSFAWIPAKNAVGTGHAKHISEIRLTAGEIQVDFADCHRTKK
jgi:hypothetical protein